MEKPTFAVLGAGHGGTAMAAHLAIQGFEVSLWNRSEERLEAIRQQGSIELLGPDDGRVTGGVGKLKAVSTAGRAYRDRIREKLRPLCQTCQ